ncbi:MAG: 50S ribosomal protein L13 [Sphaerochaetaceae bacterium]|nr:50S ribosomal protein L13 [Spirochaetales bacterium]MDY5499792.1 50S ribosomal protein L13 [Sphaerochaetaceae bacterium]
MDTIFLKPSQIQRKWYLIDAEGKELGRVAALAASLVRGKHKPEYVPHQEIGDYVVIINAEKAALTGNKAKDKMYYRHSGYVGGLRAENYTDTLKRNPVYPMEQAVQGMLSNNRLGRRLMRNVHVYAGPDHPHMAQKPEVIEVK